MSDADSAGAATTKPYYEDGSVTIYHGDCREVLPEIRGDADFLCTDPPYAAAAATVTTGWGKAKHGGNWGDMSLVGLMVTSTMDAAGAGIVQCLWMADHLGYAAIVPVLYRRFQVVQGVVWDKDVLGMGAHFRRQTEFGVYARTTGAPVGRTDLRDLVRLRPPVKTFHPAEKPVDLFLYWLGGLSWATVLDPYVGSGTTLLVAKSLGRKAIGIEIEERYCEIAAQRCSQEVLAL